MVWPCSAAPAYAASCCGIVPVHIRLGLAWPQIVSRMPRSFYETVGFAGYPCLCCGCLTWEFPGGLAVPLVKGCAVVTGCAGHKPLCSFRYLGQINTTDFFTRLLAGITFTGLAPASFYKDPSGPDRHFDGMCATCTLTLVVQDDACTCGSVWYVIHVKQARQFSASSCSKTGADGAQAW